MTHRLMCIAIVCGASSSALAQVASPQQAPAPTVAASEPPTVAASEPPSTPVPESEPPPAQVASSELPPRHGLFAGAALWGGNISCNGSSCGGFRSAEGASGQLGWSFTPRLSLLFDLWAMTSSKNDTSVTFVTSTIDARYWLMPALWVQGGIGVGHATIHAGDLAKVGDNVPVGEVAAGYDFVRGRSWALDASLQVAQGTTTKPNGGTTTGRSTGLGVHFTWYASQ